MDCTNNDLSLVVLFMQAIVSNGTDIFLKTDISGDTTSNLDCEAVNFSALFRGLINSDNEFRIVEK